MIKGPQVGGSQLLLVWWCSRRHRAPGKRAPPTLQINPNGYCLVTDAIPRLVLFALLGLTFIAHMNAEKPFDFATTPGKLPKQVVPAGIPSIVPDLDKLTFTGTEQSRSPPARPSISVLNALERSLRLRSTEIAFEISRQNRRNRNYSHLRSAGAPGGRAHRHL
jgi:hypothetical protein